MSIDLVFKEAYERVEKETMSKAGPKISTWINYIDEWINKHTELMQTFLKIPPTTKEFFILSEDITQLFLRRGVELFKNLYWILHCVLSGAYHQAIRELRHSLETMIQAYYFDTNHPQTSIEVKMGILKTLEDIEKYPTEKAIINATNLTQNQKDNLKQLYKDLSGYVHPSHTAIQSQYLHVDYNEDLLDKCEDFSKRVMDAIFELAENWIKTMPPYL